MGQGTMSKNHGHKRMDREWRPNISYIEKDWILTCLSLLRPDFLFVSSIQTSHFCEYASYSFGLFNLTSFPDELALLNASHGWANRVYAGYKYLWLVWYSILQSKV